MSLIIQIRQSNNQRQIFLFACFINIVQQILLIDIIEIDFNFYFWVFFVWAEILLHPLDLIRLS